MFSLDPHSNHLDFFLSYSLFFITTSEAYKTQNYISHKINNGGLFLNLPQRKSSLVTFISMEFKGVRKESKFIEQNE